MLPDATLEVGVETVGSDDPRWAAAGVSARRLDYWTTHSLLRTTGSGNPGSGYVRRWPVGEIAVAARMVRLTDAGLSPAAAMRGARDMELAPGIRVIIDDGGPA